MNAENGPPREPKTRSPLMEKVLGRLGDLVIEHYRECGDDRIHVAPENILAAARLLSDSPELSFDMLLDVTAVDYLGQPDGFRLQPGIWDQNRPVMRHVQQSRHRLVLPEHGPLPRFAVVYHLLSTSLIHRLRIKCRRARERSGRPERHPGVAGRQLAGTRDL